MSYTRRAIEEYLKQQAAAAQNVENNAESAPAAPDNDTPTQG